MSVEKKRRERNNGWWGAGTDKKKYYLWLSLLTGSLTVSSVWNVSSDKNTEFYLDPKIKYLLPKIQNNLKWDMNQPGEISEAGDQRKECWKF